MAQVAITIPDPLVPRVRTALRGAFPQHAALSDADLFRAIVSDHVRLLVAGWEAAEARRLAEQQAADTAEAALDQLAGIV